MAKVPLEKVKELLKEIKPYPKISERAVDFILENADKYKDLLPDIDEIEEFDINSYKALAKESMDNWRVDKSTAIFAERLAREIPIDKELFSEIESLVDELYKYIEEDLDYAVAHAQKAYTIEQYGLNAHSSILKDSLFLIVPLIAYILLSRR
jgi:hypothetical protein